MDEKILKYLTIGALILLAIVLIRNVGMSFFQLIPTKPSLRVFQVCGRVHPQYDGGSWKDYENLVTSCESKILDYTIRVSKTNYGGVTPSGYVKYGCYGKLEVYKNGVRIEPLIDNCGRNLSQWVKASSGCGVLRFDDLDIAFAQTSRFAFYDCIHLETYFWIKPPLDKFNLTMDNRNYSVGEEVKVKLNIINDWKPLNAKVNLRVCYPGVFGSVCRDFNKELENVFGWTPVEISLGKIETPTRFSVEATVDFYGTPSQLNMEKLNYGSRLQGAISVEKLGELKIGSLKKSFSFEVKKLTCEDYGYYSFVNCTKGYPETIKVDDLVCYTGRCVIPEPEFEGWFIINNTCTKLTGSEALAYIKAGWDYYPSLEDCEEALKPKIPTNLILVLAVIGVIGIIAFWLRGKI